MKLLTCERADTDVIGHIIILGITIIGLSMLMLYAVPAIYSMQDVANLKNVEQAFTVLDTRASRAVLGESPLQITTLNLGGGTLTVEPNSTAAKSYMTIKSKNDTFNVTIPMGKIKYTFEDRTVAYEGGGVWSKFPSGSLMLSPPEFHYNGVTLTLPVINVSGKTSVGGKGSSAIYFSKKGTLVHYPNVSYANRTNPVNYTATGKVYVNITSDFYDAWADYAQSLGYTRVSTNSTTRSTNIELTVVPSTLGENSPIINPVIFRGLDPTNQTPLDNFSFSLTANPISSLNWQMQASSGSKYFVIQLQGSATKVRISVGYSDTSLGYTDYAETWENDTAFTPAGNTVNINLIDQNVQMKYEKTNVPSGATCWDQIDSNKVNSTGFTWTDRVVNTSSLYNTQSLFNVTQHYIQLMAPDVSLNRCSPGGSDPINYDSSNMLVNYNAVGALTYLQITENRADVSIR